MRSRFSSRATAAGARGTLRFSATPASTTSLVPPPAPLVLTPLSAIPVPAYAPFSTPRLAFNTLAFVKSLEEAHFHRQLATEIMTATRALLVVREERAGRELLGRQEIENERYLFSAAINELKNETQVNSRNDGILLRSMATSLDRETESLTQKLREDMLGLKSDIQLDMNSRKEETSQDLKALDMNIMELNNKFTILLGEVRTEVEATKWISTRRVMSAIVAVVVVVIAFVSAPRPQPSPETLTAEELGIRGESEEAEVAGASGWFSKGKGGPGEMLV